MNIIDLMNKKHYDVPEDVTISDLKELGECISDDMSIGALLECIENLYNESLEE
ncbi:hypothetical protein [uncultured Methanobrevibacter sp.]|uniref:hypothetical protein n=1 Tax=uncultured Methanobrevibacter sp. TaxID=253161 RepID=UPI0025F9F777|nr:hypothetical protein [uncultured Methanobrevibacter sp.]